MANLNEMRISDFLKVLNYLIDNNRKLEESGQSKLAVNIEGAAGIGKTTMVADLAKERGMTFCKLNLSMLEEVGD